MTLIEMHLAPIIYTDNFVTSYLSFDMVVLIRLAKIASYIYFLFFVCTQTINNRSNNDPIMVYRVFLVWPLFCLISLFLSLDQAIFICVGLEKRN